MALLEKDIPFDTVLINLRDKPEWYGDVIESKQTPAARINGDLVGESNTILLVRLSPSVQAHPVRACPVVVPFLIQAEYMMAAHRTLRRFYGSLQQLL
jgi:hypothetical protein